MNKTTTHAEICEALHLFCKGYIDLVNLPKQEQDVFLANYVSPEEGQYLASQWAIQRHDRKRQGNFSAFYCARDSHYQRIILQKFGIKDSYADFFEKFCKLAYNKAPSRIFDKKFFPTGIPNWKNFGDFHNWALFFEFRYRRGRGVEFVEQIIRFL